jgi:GTP pyrophosphokinase
VGFVTRGRGISIHRTDCINVINATDDERMRLVSAEWNEGDRQSGNYFAEINIYAHNRSGMILDISKVMTENKIDMTNINSRVSKNGTATITMGFDVSSTEMLTTVISKLRMIEGVVDVERTMG